MIIDSHNSFQGKANIRACLSRVACLAMTLAVFTNAHAQNRHAAVHSDASYVDQADETFVGELEPEPEFGQQLEDSSFEKYFGDDNQVEQVGFLCEKSKTSCDGCCNEPCERCCPPWWAHRTGVFAQYLLLRPGNTDLTYAIEQDSVLVNDDPTGPVGRANIDEENAYRVGFSLAHSYCSSIVATYTNYFGSTSDFIQADNGNVLYSTVVHPSEVNVGDISGTSAANMGLDFQVFDLAVRHKYRSCKTYSLNWSAGVRYGNMEQDFSSQQLMPTPIGETDVNTQVDFNGFGMLLGLDAQRCWGQHGMLCYAKGIGSFLAGEWKGRYRQTSQFGGGVIGNDYEDYRVTPVVDLELGLAWQSPCGRCRANIGYVTSAWYDAVSTREYIDAVRFASYNNVQEDITFSGWTTGLEFRF